MINFGPPNTDPWKFKARKCSQHKPMITLMRATVEKNRKLGEEIGRKVATGPTCIMIPLTGVPAISQRGTLLMIPQPDLD